MSHCESCIFKANDNSMWILTLLNLLSVTSHITCIVARGLINVVYLMACAFIKSWDVALFNDVANDRWINTKIVNYVIIVSLKSDK